MIITGKRIQSYNFFTFHAGLINFRPNQYLPLFFASTCLPFQFRNQMRLMTVRHIYHYPLLKRRALYPNEKIFWKMQCITWQLYYSMPCSYVWVPVAVSANLGSSLRPPIHIFLNESLAGYKTGSGENFKMNSVLALPNLERDVLPPIAAGIVFCDTIKKTFPSHNCCRIKYIRSLPPLLPYC